MIAAKGVGDEGPAIRANQGAVEERSVGNTDGTASDFPVNKVGNDEGLKDVKKVGNSDRRSIDASHVGTANLNRQWGQT